jgi:protein SCO1
MLASCRWGRASLPAVVAMATIVAALSACDRGQAPAAVGAFKSVDITGAAFANTLALPDADGTPRTLADFKGKVAIVFFGYTQCPDVCPTTLAEIAQLKKALGADGNKVIGVFVTVDPTRDTAEIVKAYVASFGNDFVALRTDDEALLKATTQHFKVYFNRVPGATPTSYTVDHSVMSYLYDREGRVRLFTRPGTKPEDLLHDVRQLLR